MNKVKTLPFRRRQDVDMTEGNIFRHLITFAFPLLVGNLFQQLYNAVDTWVVGNYVSDEAFAAVGTVGPIINMLIGFFLGFSSGAGVIISQYYGAGQHEKVNHTVHTAILITLILGVLFTGIGISMTPFMLQAMNTDPEVLPESTAYLTIYFSGILGLMLYNIGSGILRAVGGSQRPFYFLVVSALLNTVLDLVFVLVFDMGVEGVALATIIAQGTSALLVLITLMRATNCIKFSFSKLRLHLDILLKMIKVGLPAALQMTITSFSNVFVQSYINAFGKFAMAGWTAYAKIDQLLFLPMQSLALASTTFVGQNLGKNQVDRAKRGVSISLSMAIGSTVILMIPVIVFAPYTVAFFNDEPQVVEVGTMLLRYITPFYVLCTVNQVYSGALRGAGNTRAPMFIMLGSFVLFRQIYLFVMSNYISNTFLAIAMGYPAGWLLCSTITLIYYHRTKLTKTRLVE
ncbi:MAG: MATE family efflux transporter [Clostridia bacterium]|nr:MATE family efflux transporter [Clostridia bacterium]